MSNLRTRVLAYCDYKNIAISSFEKQCGLSNGYFYQVKKRPSRAKLEDIKRVFPDINLEWLLTGEGQMLVDSENISQSGTQNIQQSAKGNHITQRAEGFNFDRVLALLEKNAEMMGNTLEKKDEQMDKLLEIIANLSKQ